MGEHLADVLLKTADVLHWFGRYTECNALILTSRLLRLRNLDTLDKLDAFVTDAESTMLQSSGDTRERG